MTIGKTWVSDELGYSLEYAPERWTPQDSSVRDIRLKNVSPEYGDPILWIRATPAAEKAPDQLYADQLAALKGQVVGLTTDTRPENTILDPEIGFQRGIRGTYTGTTDSPQGPGKPVVVFIETATNGRITISAALILVGDFTLDTSRESPAIWFREEADFVLNSITWPSP